MQTKYFEIKIGHLCNLLMGGVGVGGGLTCDLTRATKELGKVAQTV